MERMQVLYGLMCKLTNVYICSQNNFNRIEFMSHWIVFKKKICTVRNRLFLLQRFGGFFVTVSFLQFKTDPAAQCHLGKLESQVHVLITCNLRI